MLHNGNISKKLFCGMKWDI